MARRTVPYDECVQKRLTICAAARAKMRIVKAQLVLAGLPSWDEVVINKMLREFPVHTGGK